MSTVENTERRSDNRSVAVYVQHVVLAYFLALTKQVRADLAELRFRLEAARQMFLTEVLRQRRMYARGQTNLGNLFIGIMIAAIIAIRVFIPTVQDAIASSNVSGTTKTILDMLSLFAALLLLISLASPLMNRS